MKKIVKYSLIACLTAIFGACTSDRLMDWEGGENIYFTNLMRSGDFFRARDTVDLRFFFMPADANEILVPLSVTATGVFTDEDREVLVSATSFLSIDGTHTEIPFEEGVDFEVERSFIRAGRIEDTVWVRVFRSPSLDGEGRLGFIGLTLQPNQHFGTDLRETRDRPTDTSRSLLTSWIQVSDAIVRPQFWENSFFGPYSAQKFRIIGTANPGMPLAFLDGAYWGDVRLGEVTFMQRFGWWTVIATAAQDWLDTWHRDPTRDTIWEPELNSEGMRVMMSMGSRIAGN